MFHMLDVLLEGSRIHGYQDVAFVTGGMYVCSHAYLEARYASKRALRGTDFSRIIREGGNLIA